MEGPEDEAYILANWDRLGYDWIPNILPCGGKGEVEKTAKLAAAFGVEVYVVFDSDKNGRDTHNCNLGDFLGLPETCEFDESKIEAGYAYWRDTIKEDVEADLSGFSIGKDAEKNPLKVAQALSTAFDAGHESATLDELCMRIKSFLDI